jgi:anthranilate 1,2-dioxygenase small subunit
MNPLGLREQVEQLLYDCADSIDGDQLEQWPDFFVDDCLYKIVSRENYDRKFPLALIRCESKGMLIDRVNAIRKTQMFAPRSIRHMISSVRIKSDDHEGIVVQSNYLVLQTLVDDETRIFNSGRYLDLIVREGDILKFKRRICVYDTVLIPNSLVYPI